MRVLHINCNYMTTALHQKMIEHLDQYTENAVFCPIRKGLETTTKPDEHVVAPECFNTLDRALYFVKQAKIRSALEKRIDVSSFQFIHAYTLMTDGNCAMRLSQKYHIPYCVAIRDTDINDFFRLKPYLIPLGIKIMENASAVFFLSKAYRERMLNDFISAAKRAELEKKMHIVPNGIDDFWLEHRYLDRDIEATLNRLQNKELNVVCVGQIIKRKNIPMLQEALSILQKKGWKTHLDVIGKKVDNDEYEKITSYPDTTYHAPVPKEKLIEFYRKSDIFVLPSLTETFGLVYAEAMTQGLPVIYTKGQGFDQQFAEGVAGYSISPGSPEDIAEKLLQCVDNYAMISGRCWQQSAAFNWNDICLGYYECYQRNI